MGFFDWVAARPGAIARFIGHRVPEIVIVGAGIALRFAMLFGFDVRTGYDAPDHWPYIEWFRQQWSLPPLMLCRETYHPPLYYVIAGLFDRLVVDVRLLGLPSIVFGSLTLLLVWWGLERHLVGYRLARIAALFLAAVMPSSVHMAGMMTAEALNGFLSLASLLLAADLLARPGQGRMRKAVLLGVLLGLEMLTKISALVIIAAVLAGAGLDFLWTRASLTERIRRALPWLVVLVALTATSGWYFARNQQLYGKAILSGFDGVDGALAPPGLEDTPYLDRRPLGFFVGWTNDVLMFPYYPSGIKPASRFWPVLVTSTFVDYYDYAFVRFAPKSTITANGRPIFRQSVNFARASAVGGALIALTTVIGWLCAAYHVFKMRDAPRSVLLLAPALVLIGQLHFVVRYPLDFEGPTKGLYMQFASAPLLAVFGLALSWLTSKRPTRVIAIAEVLALAAVATYTVYARLT